MHVRAHSLTLSPATVPELYQKLSSQGVPVTAVVRLMPILQSQIPGF